MMPAITPEDNARKPPSVQVYFLLKHNLTFILDCVQKKSLTESHIFSRIKFYAKLEIQFLNDLIGFLKRLYLKYQ